MKRTYKVLALTLCLATLLASCGKKKEEPAKAQEPAQPTVAVATAAPESAPAPAAQEPAPVEAPAKKEVKGPSLVYSLEGALQGQPKVNQCYNAREWKKGYSLKEIIEKNFWWQPDEQDEFSTGTFGDPYLDSAPYAKGGSRLVVDKYVTFMKDDPSLKYDVFTGAGQSATYDCNYKVYMVCGPEALLFVPYEEIAMEGLFDLNEGMYLVGANAYDVYDVDGKKTTIDENSFSEGKLVRDQNGNISAVFGSLVIENVKDIAASGMSASIDPVDEGIVHMVVAQNAVGVYGEEATFLGNVAGAYYKGYVLGKLAESYGISSDTLTLTLKDSGDVEVASADAASYRLIYLKKSDAYVLLKEHQIKGESGDAFMGVTKVVAGDTAFVYKAKNAPATELLAGAGSQGNDFEVTGKDGKVSKVTEKELEEIKVSEVKSVAVVD